jgi:Ca2+-binding RTX toxin-like protein
MVMSIETRTSSSALQSGSSGNDTITGGAGADQLFGQGGDDTLIGRGGADLLFGGDGNDRLAGDTGNDQMFGGAGDDRMVWNSGDGSDIVEGGSDIDTVEIIGGKAGEQFAVTANGERVRFDRVDVAGSSLDIGTTEKLEIHAGGGNDRISAVGNLAALIELTFDGGDGHDTVLGGNGNDLLFGGNGNDFVDGNQGADQVWLGAGNDVFSWDPGDGSDVVEGGAGEDSVILNGSAGAETIDLSANSERLRLTRDLGNIAMDVNDVETVQIVARDNTDKIFIHDLSGTDAKLVAVDLVGNIGTGGDGQVDMVLAQGTTSSDAITVTALNGQVAVQGLFAQVTVDHAEATDKLVVGGFDGDDTIDASTLAVGTVSLLLSGDGGDDVVLGSAGADQVIGGVGGDALFGNDGDDIIAGGVGDDLLAGGAGSDTFRLTTVLDGHDIIIDFDGDAAGGQDVYDLSEFFLGSGVPPEERVNRVQISDQGSSVNVYIDANNVAADGFEFLAATLQTSDAITLGQDVIVGTI